MPDKPSASEYAPLTRWTFAADLAEFEHSFVVRRVQEHPEQGLLVELAIGATKQWLDCLGHSGVLLGMTISGLERSGTTFVAADAPLPEWVSRDFVTDEEVDSGWVEGVVIVAPCTGSIDEALLGIRERLLTFRRSICFGLLDRLALLVANDPTILHRQVDDSSLDLPLHVAAAAGQAAAVRYLLDQGASVNARGADGATPLHSAAENGRTDVVRLLLEHGADPQALTETRRSVLRAAAECGQWRTPSQEIVQLLEEHGVQPDLNVLLLLGRAGSARDWLARDSNAYRDAPSLMRLLPDCLAVMNRLMAERREAGQEDRDAAKCIIAEYLPIIQALLQQGADAKEASLLPRAVQWPDLAVARLILENGADPNADGSFLADQVSDPDMRALLLEFGGRSHKDPDLEVERLSGELQDDPDNAESYLRRGMAWRKLGQYGKALADFERALEIDPEDSDIYCQQAWIWATCPEEQFQAGPRAVASATQGNEMEGFPHLVVDDDTNVFHDTFFWITLAAAQAAVGNFEEAQTWALQADGLTNQQELRAHLDRLLELIPEQQPYREPPPSARLAAAGVRLAELDDLAAEAVVIGPPDGPDARAPEAPAFSINEEGELRVVESDFNVDWLRRLLAFPGLVDVRTLDLWQVTFGAEGLNLLVETLHAPHLERLELRSGSTTYGALRDPSALQLLATLRWPRLNALCLSGNKLGNATAQAVAATSSLASLTHLDLSSNRIRVAGVQALAGSSHLAALSALNLSSNKIRDEGACLVAAAPYWRHLTSLQLSGNRLTARAVSTLVASPVLRTVQVLNLSWNRIREDGVKLLTDAAHLTSLTRLDLSSNPIGETGAQLLAESPHLQRLEHLSVSEKAVGAKGARALSKCFGTRLDLSPF